MKNRNLIFLIAITLSLVVSCEIAENKSPLIYSQWHTITLSFEGPETAENAVENPFWTIG